MDVKYLRLEITNRLPHPLARMGRIKDRRRSMKLAAEAMNRVIILFQQLHAVAALSEQFDLVTHDRVFAAAELIPVMSYQNSHHATNNSLSTVAYRHLAAD